MIFSCEISKWHIDKIAIATSYILQYICVYYILYCMYNVFCKSVCFLCWLLTIDYPTECVQTACTYHDFNSHSTNYERIGFTQFYSGFNRETLLYYRIVQINNFFFLGKVTIEKWDKKTSIIQLVDKHFVQTRINTNIGDTPFTTWTEPKVKNSTNKRSIRIRWITEKEIKLDYYCSSYSSFLLFRFQTPKC